jgi:hypothetical protein
MEKVQLLTTPYPLTTVPVSDRLRDEFAMAALTGLLAARFITFTDGRFYAETAYALADAMLKQRETS